MSKNKKKTAGKAARDLQCKPDEKINPIELQREIHKGKTSDDSYESQVMEAVKRGELCFEGDFFVVVLFKKERLLQNVVRQYFLPRKSCPTPEYDQVVYKYYRFENKLEFIWVLPDIKSCEHLPRLSNQLPAEQQQFLQFIKDFHSGALDRLCAKLNGENIEKKGTLKKVIIE